MSTTNKSLPLEVWLNILPYIDNIKDLAQCRLVCKAWDPVAEKAMFSQTTFPFTTDENTAVQLHYHLTKKPFLGKHIKQVQIKYSSWGNNIKFTNPLMVKLCKLVFTPELEVIEGWALDDDFYDMLLDIMNDSPQPFSHFKAIPVSFELDSLPYSQVLCKAKDTLEFMGWKYIPYNPTSAMQLVMDCLDKFVKLKEIELTLTAFNMEQIDAVLQKLQNVESLTLRKDSGGFRGNTGYEIQAWMEQHVQKSEKMKEVHLQKIGEKAYTAHLINYILYKYPKLEALALVITDMGEHLDEVFQSVEQVPHVRIETFVEWPEEMRILGRRFKSKTNKITIRYVNDLTFDDQEGAEVDILRNNNTQHTDFVLFLTPYLRQRFGKCLLQNFCFDPSWITDLDIDMYLHGLRRDEDEPGMFFYTLMRFLNYILYTKSLTFCDKKIEHPPSDLDELVLRELTHLQFSATVISPGVLSLISKIAPKLRHLDLFTCLLLNKGKKYQHMNIDLPESALDSIVLKMGTHDYEEKPEGSETKMLAAMEKEINSMNSIHLCLETEGSPKQYFALKSGVNTVKSISQMQYMMHGNKIATLHIKSKSLKALHVHLTEYDIHMAWDANGKLLPQA